MDHRSPRGRYRGSRRAPTPPRSRYAAVVTTAFVGAGVVALASGAALGDHDESVRSAAFGSQDHISASALADRQATVDRADRATRDATGQDQAQQQTWLLPLRNYTVSTAFAGQWDQQHPGVNLTASEGTPYYAVASGTVKLARWDGGRGFTIVIDHGNGITTAYSHSAKLLVKEGQRVEAGDKIGLVGNTGYSFGCHLHFEVRVNDKVEDPMTFMKQHGVDIQAQTEEATGGVIES